jgi:hypothetical protein
VLNNEQTAPGGPLARLKDLGKIPIGTALESSWRQVLASVGASGRGSP